MKTESNNNSSSKGSSKAEAGGGNGYGPLPPLESLESARAGLRDLRTRMAFLKGLTPTERAMIPRVTPSALNRMEHALEGVRQNPRMLPTGVTVEDFEYEVATSRALFSLLTDARQLCSDIQDTLTATAREARHHGAGQCVGQGDRAQPAHAGTDAARPASPPAVVPDCLRHRGDVPGPSRAERQSGAAPGRRVAARTESGVARPA